MNCQPSSSDDAFDDLLGGRPLPPCDEALRRSILVRTGAVVRRRSHMRRIRWTVALAACALVAFGGFLFFRPSERSPRLITPPPEVAVTPPPMMAPVADLPAAVLERIGETSPPDQRAEIYRRAGDRYLEEAADSSSALRCYTQALDDGSPQDLTFSANDSWLLMALKMDRRKEKNDENHD